MLLTCGYLPAKGQIQHTSKDFPRSALRLRTQPSVTPRSHSRPRALSCWNIGRSVKTSIPFGFDLSATIVHTMEPRQFSTELRSMSQTSNSTSVESTSETQRSKKEVIAGKERAREAGMRLLSTNSRFRQAPKSGRGVVILGARTNSTA